MDVTEGHLLGGRVRYAQPRVGYRTGIEPVLLAAAIAARAGERVLEAGCGAGAGLLCLAARVPGITGLGVELDPGMAALARDNVARNGFEGLSVEAIDLLAFEAPAAFDHAFANPPWHAEKASASPVAGRDVAKRAREGLLEAWIEALVRAVKPGGTITLALPAGQFAAAGAGLLAAGAGGVWLLPLWPRADEAAKLVLVGAARGSRAVARVLPGLVLHEGGGFTPAARLILSDGESLPAAILR